VVEDSRVIIEHVIPTGPVRLQTEHHAPAGPYLTVCWMFQIPPDLMVKTQVIDIVEVIL
jgi:hypothetical protein